MVGKALEFLGCSSLELEKELNFSVSYVESLPCDLLFFPLPPYKLCPADSPWLEQPEVQLLLQTVINVLLPPRIDQGKVRGVLLFVRMFVMMRERNRGE